MTRRHASVVGDMKVSRKSMGVLMNPMKQGGTADKEYSSLTEELYYSVKDFFMYRGTGQKKTIRGRNER